MSLELKARIGMLVALEALEFMAKKAGVDAQVIMDGVVADPDGNTASYFAALVHAGMREVPQLLAA